MSKLKKDFFAKNTLEVAKNLLGCTLCRRVGNKIYKGAIVETEAYTQEDPACHAYCGLTKRSKTLFEKPGTIYVYLIYGVHYCVNVVTEKENYGSAVLIRALEPLEDTNNTNGPGKLCKCLEITTELNGCDATHSKSPLWFEKGEDIPDENIVQTTRIGIKKAADYKWRFYVKDNKWVSKR